MTHLFRLSIKPGLPPGTDTCFPRHIRVVPEEVPDNSGNLRTYRQQPESQIELTADQLADESNEDFEGRIQYEIERELLRISVFTGIFYQASITDIEPMISRTHNIQVSAGWLHRSVKPRAVGKPQIWTGAVETKLMLWRRVSEDRSDPMLVYAYLFMICELDGFEDWDPESELAPSVSQEIRLIRNLLLHSKEKPRASVVAYCKVHNLSPDRNPREVEAHKQHARDRLHALLGGVWKMLLKDVGVLTNQGPSDSFL